MLQHLVLLSVFCIALGLTPPSIRAQQAIHGDAPSPIYIGIGPNFELREKKMTAVRDWIWGHWHDHRAGHLQVTITSIEGQDSRSNIAIKPDAEGTCHVMSRIERLVGAKVQSTDEFDSVLLKKVPIVTGGPLELPSPGTSGRSSPAASEYELEFYDGEHKVVAHF
jgi:hypothetical protein